MFFFSQGFFFPVFYLQLDAIVHHVDPTFAFYAVRNCSPKSLLLRYGSRVSIRAYFSLLAHDPE